MLRTKLLVAWAEKLVCVYIEMLVHLPRFLSQSSGVSFRKDVDCPINISLYNDKFRQGEANSNLARLKIKTKPEPYNVAFFKYLWRIV